MMMNVMIVGAGPAGLACALWCRRLGLTVQVFEAATVAGGQLNLITYSIPDYPGVVIPGEELRDRCLHQAQDAGAEILLDTPVTGIDIAQMAVQVNGKWMATRNIVLATGGTPRRLNIPGEEDMYRRGEVYRGSRDRPSLVGKSVVIVGGGDRAVENAALLAAQGTQVTLVYRSAQLRARLQLVQQLQQFTGITMLPETTVQAIVGEQQVTGVELYRADQTEFHPAHVVLIYIGLMPNSQLVAGQLSLELDGRIPTDAWGATAVANVYAIGDVCLPPAFSSISTCFGQAMTVAKRISMDF